MDFATAAVLHRNLQSQWQDIRLLLLLVILKTGPFQVYRTDPMLLPMLEATLEMSFFKSYV